MANAPKVKIQDTHHGGWSRFKEAMQGLFRSSYGTGTGVLKRTRCYGFAKPLSSTVLYVQYKHRRPCDCLTSLNKCSVR